MNQFIVLEGLDGAGKSTQFELLKSYLKQQNIRSQYMHFPRTDTPTIYGEMVANFLKGDYGKINEVNPYLVALLYAGDRNDAKEQLNEWLNQGYFLLVDRYVYSNMAYQGAKIENKNEKEKLNKWIVRLEYEYNKIPRPNLSIFLHMNFEFVSQKLKDARQGADRKYLGGKEDIHESNLEFQEKVEAEYMNLVAEQEDFYAVDCFDEKGETLSPEAIHRKIIDLLVTKRIL
ncbi:MAG TPA: dTMP kinase [Candidatus Kapabacteria bacterium]|nr:dTMP kinase [Candidatus Kapabacteria bacterium]